MIFKLSIIYILFHIAKSTFEAVDRSTSLIGIIQPTYGVRNPMNRRANKVLAFPDNTFVIVYIGDSGKC